MVNLHGRIIPTFYLSLLITTIVGWPSIALVEPHRFATVPALGVGAKDGMDIGHVHYIVIQLDHDPSGRGPTVQFSERWRGSAVGDRWKDGVRIATVAAANAVGQDHRFWMVTIQNRTYTSLTEGSSASAAVAVGLMAAWRGDTLRPDIALTGVITSQGTIKDVDALPSKLEGAASAGMQIMLVPRGQARTREWDLFELGKLRNITVIEIGSLQEAYERMAVSRR